MPEKTEASHRSSLLGPEASEIVMYTRARSKCAIPANCTKRKPNPYRIVHSPESKKKQFKALESRVERVKAAKALTRR